MDLLAERDGKEIWLYQIERPFVFESPFSGRPYVAIVFSNDKTVKAEERISITRSMFASGCRYGVFAGYESEKWQFSLDLTCVESDPSFTPSDEAFTMTTSHESESVKGSIFYGLMCTDFGSHDFNRFLILFIGSRTGLRDEVEAAIQSVSS
jgi:hypothetical protein